MCGFDNVNDSTASLNWRRGRPTPTTIDHTTSSVDGSFAYIDMTEGKQLSNARLQSQPFHPNVECLQFWYLASGLNASSLAIYEKVGSVYGSPIWIRNSHENEDWRFGQVTIGMDEQISTVFEGIKLTNEKRGELGIDDIEYKSGNCSLQGLGQYDCDFEDFSLCTWQQSKKDDLDWLLNQGFLDSAIDIGPQVDVTLGTDKGVYAYVESNYPARKNEKALLLSDFIPAKFNESYTHQFGLYYFMNGKSVGQFNIYTIEGANNMTLLKSFTGINTNGWAKLDLIVPNDNEYRIVIEAVVCLFKPYFL